MVAEGGGHSDTAWVAVLRGGSNQTRLCATPSLSPPSPCGAVLATQASQPGSASDTRARVTPLTKEDNGSRSKIRDRFHPARRPRKTAFCLETSHAASVELYASTTETVSSVDITVSLEAKPWMAPTPRWTRLQSPCAAARRGGLTGPATPAGDARRDVRLQSLELTASCASSTSNPALSSTIHHGNAGAEVTQRHAHSPPLAK